MSLEISTCQGRTPALTIALDSNGHSELVRVILQSEAPGVITHAGRPSAVVAVQAGRPVRLQCNHGRECYAGLAVHGDIEVIPPGISASWDTKDSRDVLIVMLTESLLKSAAEAIGCGGERPTLRSRFQIRDARLEHIAWALKAEVEQGYPGGRLYLDSLATALAVQLVRAHSSVSPRQVVPRGGLPPNRLRQLMTYIEERLHEQLPLNALADLVGLSPSQLKTLFRRSVGMPVHQYIIRQRVERAVLLLRENRLPISQVALEAGFAHQSHLALHIRRLLGVTPRQLRGSDPDSSKPDETRG
jgi:AraC family transcriptional regulator